MTLISSNIKYLRKLNSLTQEQLADKVGVKRSLIGAYEEGRAEPNIQNLLKFSEILNVALDDFLQKDLNQSVFKNADKAYKSPEVKVLSVTVNSDGLEQIHLVPQKASAGYMNGYADAEYIAELPLFSIPYFKNGTYRAFEIKGDSMLPLVSGAVVIGKYIDDWSQIKDSTRCVLVTQQDGLVFKMVNNHLAINQTFELVSTNTFYTPYQVPVGEVLEIWEAKGYFSTTFPEQPDAIQEILSEVKYLQNELRTLKK